MGKTRFGSQGVVLDVFKQKKFMTNVMKNHHFFLEHFPNSDDDDDMRDIILCAGSVNRVEGVCGKHLVSLRLGRRQTDRVNLCGSKRKSSFDSQCLLSTKVSEERRLTKQGVPILQSRTCRSFFSTLI